MPLEEIKELPGVEYDEYVAEQRKEKLREEEEEGDAATRAPLRLSDLPRQEQERQIREKLKALERGDDTRLSSLAPSSSSASSAPSQPTATAPSEERDRERKRSREREGSGDRAEAEGKERRTRRSRSPEEKRRRRSRSNSRERDYDDSGRH